MCCETNNAHEHGGCCSSDEHRAHASHGHCCSSHVRCHSLHEHCCSPHGLVRLFVSSKERLAKLEAYRDELSKELDGVNEHISELSEG
jgi:hypothetical protein